MPAHWHTVGMVLFTGASSAAGLADAVLAKQPGTGTRHKARKRGANIVSATVHLNERAPHFVAHVLPLTKDGGLSAGR